MKKLIFPFIISILIAGCGANNKPSSPVDVVKAFIETSKSGDMDGIKKYITKQDAALLDLGQSLLKNIDSAQVNIIKEKMSNEFKEKAKDYTIQTGSEKINGDNATVDVSVTADGQTKTQPFELKKEEGEWKISLISTGLKASGMKQEDIDNKMQKLSDKLNENPALKDSMAKAIEKIKNISPDSLKKIMDHAKKNAEYLKDALEKANH